MTYIKSLVPCAALALLLLPPTTLAAECKGMKQSKCESAKNCTYVKGYKTKTGTKVSAYCRNASKKSSKSK
jgi:hypothetical protein